MIMDNNIGMCYRFNMLLLFNAFYAELCSKERKMRKNDQILDT